LFEVRGDPSFVPDLQDGFDIWEVLVERRTPDAAALTH